MNYGDLLYRAHENKCNASNSEVRCYKTGFAPPQKLQKSKVSSDNIKKFLARKEEEERKRLVEAQRKKDELLALRSQDKKAQKRVQVMLKRTKSANKSVMEDAIDNINTADTINGPNQCDNDDYGYVSQEASAFYSKLMSKYENMPAEPSIFSKGKKEVKDLAAAKDRVKLALQKEAEEAELPHKRKRKSKKDASSHEEIENDSHSDDDHKDNQSHSSKEEKSKSSSKPDNVDSKIKKKRPPAPPPLNFNELLKIAKEKQHEPIMVDTSGKELETPRLMTSKEKAEYLKEEERKRNRLIRERGGHVSSGSSSHSSQSSHSPQISQKESQSVGKEISSSAMKRIPKLSDKEKDSKPKEKVANVQKTEKISVKKPINNNDIKVKSDVSERLKKSGDVWQKSCNLSTKADSKNNLLKKSTLPSKETSRITSTSKVKTVDKSLLKETATTDEYIPKPKNNVNKELSDIDREIQMLVQKKMDLAMKAQAEKIAAEAAPKYIPTAIKPNTKLAHPSKTNPANRPYKPYKPVPKQQKKPMKRRIDSDSEYDSELDDFIDDGPEEGEDYSRAIKEIFGYDKSRYRDYEEDDECMESNYAQQMREEFVSTKIGIMEDLEDIRKEQEEKKLKAKKMKLKRF